MPQGQDTGAPQLLHSLEPRRLAGGGGVDSGHRVQGDGWLQASGLWEEWGGQARLWPRPTAPLPCWACPVPPTGPWAAGLAVSPSTHLFGQVLGEAPRWVQPLCPADPPAALGHLPQPEHHRQAPGVTSVGFVRLGAEGLIVSEGCRDQKTG